MIQQTYKRSLSGSVGSGMRSVFGGNGRRFYILEHKVSSKYHKAGECQQIIVDQIETCKQMALNGIGYAILPSITLTGHEDVNKIPLTNNEEEFELTRDTWLIGYDSSFELPQVEAFVKIVNEHAKKFH